MTGTIPQIDILSNELRYQFKCILKVKEMYEKRKKEDTHSGRYMPCISDEFIEEVSALADVVAGRHLNKWADSFPCYNKMIWEDEYRVLDGLVKIWEDNARKLISDCIDEVET